MAEQTNKPKRLPKELQDYKREVKKLPFKEKVKAYFDCSPYTRDIDRDKKEIILSILSKEEKGDFYRLYQPIHNAIERYGDRVRAINSNVILYTNYINSKLRQIDTYNFTADFLNLALPMIEEALDNTTIKSNKETLTRALRLLQGYRMVTPDAPDIKLNKKSLYEVPTEEEEKFLLGAIETLKGLLILLKCYLEALKEFMVWVGTPELLPKEFADMEHSLKMNYKPIAYDELPTNPEADKFPLFYGKSRVKRAFLSIDYEALPIKKDILGERNLFANVYRSFFSF